MNWSTLYRFIGLIILPAGCLLLSSCAQEKAEESLESLTIRLPADPERLNPMLSRSGYATQIENNIFMSLFDHDPESLEWKPFLAAGQPEIAEGPEINDQKSTALTFTLRDIAQWPDGTPVTSEDYLFTLKASLNPYVPSATWRGFLTYLLDVRADPNDARRFTVFVNRDYMLGMEISSGFAIYPKHIYDPEGYLDGIEFQTLKTIEEGEISEELDNNLKKFADHFNTAKYSSEIVVGSGPYELQSYQSGQQIELSKKSNWWGEDLFEAFPERINYLIIPDEPVALSALREGNIDIMAEVSPQYFAELKSSSEGEKKFQFHSAPIFQIYYISLNNQSPKLENRNVRRALAHLMDLEFMVEEIMEGYAEPIPSVVHPAKPEFYNQLEAVEFSIEKADSLLNLAGWIDSDGDGIRDREVDGKKIDLSLEMDISSGEIGRQVALVFKEGAEKTGVEVNIEQGEFRLIRQDLSQGNYEMTPLVLRQTLFLTDLYQNWHSDAIGPTSNNVSAYSNPRVDELIEEIQLERNKEKLFDLYKEVQELIYHDQPVIFLVAPKERIIVRNGIDVVISAKRPGYSEATARLSN